MGRNEQRVVQFCPSLGKACGVGALAEKFAQAFGHSRAADLRELSGEIPTHLHVQHEFSLFSRRELGRVIDFCKNHRVALVVSMHTVRPVVRDWRTNLYYLFLGFEKFLVRMKGLWATPPPHAPSPAPPRRTGPPLPAARETGPSGWYRKGIGAVRGRLLRLAGKNNPDLDEKQAPSWEDLSCQDLIIRHADQIVVHNSSARNFLVRSGFRADRAVLFPFPLERFEVSNTLFSQEDGKRHVGYFGFLQPHKGILELIEACDMLQDVVLHLWASTGNNHRPLDFERMVLDMAAERKWIRLTTGHLPLQEVVSNLSRCDINVLYPRQLKSFLYASGSIREYLAAKRPVVAADIQAFEEIRHLVHPVPPGRPELLAQAISGNLVTPDSLQDYLDEHTWENSRLEYIDAPSRPGCRPRPVEKPAARLSPAASGTWEERKEREKTCPRKRKR